MPALPAAPGTLDLGCLNRLRATLGSEESFQGLLHDFMSSSASLSRQLHAGLAGAPPREVGRAAHTLKSMARLVGASKLGETCRQVETLSHAAPARFPPALILTAISQLDETRRAVGSLMS